MQIIDDIPRARGFVRRLAVSHAGAIVGADARDLRHSLVDRMQLARWWVLAIVPRLRKPLVTKSSRDADDRGQQDAEKDSSNCHG